MDIVLKKEQDALGELKAAATLIAEQCNSITITDEISLAVANQRLSLAKEIVANIEAKREELKKPYFQAGKSIDKLAKELKEPLEQALASGNTKIVAYTKAESARLSAIKATMVLYYKNALKWFKKASTIDQLMRVNKIWVTRFPEDKWNEFQEDADRLRLTLRQFAQNRKIEIEAPKEADETVAAVIEEKIEEQVAGVAEVQLKAVHTTKIKVDFEWELVDISVVPRDWLMLDDKKIRAWKNQNKETLKEGVYNGVKFIQVDSAKIK